MWPGASISAHESLEEVARRCSAATSRSNSRSPARQNFESATSASPCVIPSASVQRRGSFIEEPSASRTTRLALRTDKTSSSRPCSGWWRRTTVTLAGTFERKYLVCDTLPLGKNAAFEVAPELALHVRRHRSVVSVALAPVGKPSLEVRLSPCDRAACARAAAGGTAWGRLPRSANAPPCRAPAPRGAIMVACRRVCRDRPYGRARRRAL